jgi:hypothetical protein
MGGIRCGGDARRYCVRREMVQLAWKLRRHADVHAWKTPISGHSWQLHLAATPGSYTSIPFITSQPRGRLG